MSTPAVATPAISVCSTAIRQHNNLYNLNDLHRASGSARKHQPANFVRLEQTQGLADEIRSSDLRIIPIKRVIGKGKPQGTYACRELVIAYAAWISPAFHLKVIRVFLDQVGQGAPRKALPEAMPEKPATLDPLSEHYVRLYVERLRGAIAHAKNIKYDLYKAFDAHAIATQQKRSIYDALGCHLLNTCSMAFKAWEHEAETIEQSMKALRVLSTEMKGTGTAVEICHG